MSDKRLDTSSESKSGVGAVFTYDVIAQAIDRGDYASARVVLAQLSEEDERSLSEAEREMIAQWRHLLSKDPLAIYVMVVSIVVLVVIALLLYAK